MPKLIITLIVSLDHFIFLIHLIIQILSANSSIYPVLNQINHIVIEVKYFLINAQLIFEAKISKSYF